MAGTGAMSDMGNQFCPRHPRNPYPPGPWHYRPARRTLFVPSRIRLAFTIAFRKSLERDIDIHTPHLPHKGSYPKLHGHALPDNSPYLFPIQGRRIDIAEIIRPRKSRCRDHQHVRRHLGHQGPRDRLANALHCQREDPTRDAQRPEGWDFDPIGDAFVEDGGVE